MAHPEHIRGDSGIVEESLILRESDLLERGNNSPHDS